MSQVEGEQVTPSCREVAELGRGDRACCTSEGKRWEPRQGHRSEGLVSPLELASGASGGGTACPGTCSGEGCSGTAASLAMNSADAGTLWLVKRVLCWSGSCCAQGHVKADGRDAPPDKSVVFCPRPVVMPWHPVPVGWHTGSRS